MSKDHVLNQFTTQTQNPEVMYWITHNLKNYLWSNVLNISEVEHIIDYMNSEQAPKRLKKMSYEEAVKQSTKWLKSQIKKGYDINENAKDIEVVYDLGNGMRLVQLIGRNAFKREGYLMAHCVSSYADRDNTAVYSLRDSKNMPHCTIEVSKNNVQQIKGKGNGAISPKYIYDIIDICENFFKLQIRESEMENLGYICIKPYQEDRLNRLFSGAQYEHFNGKKYLYLYSNIKEIV